MLFSHILLPVFYKDLYAETLPYLFPAIASQIFYFISGVLLVVLLRFRGEKKQFFFNFGYAAEFFVLVIIGTCFFGLKGFVWFSLIANLIRFLAVIPWGYLPPRAPKEKDGEIREERGIS